jgi:nitrate/nitrite transporter NarK
MTLQRFGWRISGTATAALFIVPLFYAFTDSESVLVIEILFWISVALIAMGLLMVLIGSNFSRSKAN